MIEEKLVREISSQLQRINSSLQVRNENDYQFNRFSLIKGFCGIFFDEFNSWYDFRGLSNVKKELMLLGSNLSRVITLGTTPREIFHPKTTYDSIERVFVDVCDDDEKRLIPPSKSKTRETMVVYNKLLVECLKVEGKKSGVFSRKDFSAFVLYKSLPADYNYISGYLRNVDIDGSGKLVECVKVIKFRDEFGIIENYLNARKEALEPEYAYTYRGRKEI